MRLSDLTLTISISVYPSFALRSSSHSLFLLYSRCLTWWWDTFLLVRKGAYLIMFLMSLNAEGIQKPPSQSLYLFVCSLTRPLFLYSFLSSSSLSPSCFIFHVFLCLSSVSPRFISGHKYWLRVHWHNTTAAAEAVYISKQHFQTYYTSEAFLCHLTL